MIKKKNLYNMSVCNVLNTKVLHKEELSICLFNAWTYTFPIFS